MERELDSKDLRVVVTILIVGMLAVIGVLFWASRTIAQEKKTEYKLTEVQLLRLQVIQKDAFLIKSQMNDLQRQFAEKVGDLQRTAEKVKLENSWPPDTQFNMDTLTFSAPEKEAKK